MDIEVVDAHGASVVIEHTDSDGKRHLKRYPEDNEEPKDKHKARKERPIYSGVLKYFPDALMEVAHCSWAGNEQHNPGTPLHWDRSKSADELDAMMRHMLEIDKEDDDGILHATKVAWRGLAYLQKLLERQKEGEA